MEEDGTPSETALSPIASIVQGIYRLLSLSKMREMRHGLDSNIAVATISAIIFSDAMHPRIQADSARVGLSRTLCGYCGARRTLLGGLQRISLVSELGGQVARIPLKPINSSEGKSLQLRGLLRYA